MICTWTGAPWGIQVQKSLDLHLDRGSVGASGAKKQQNALEPGLRGGYRCKKAVICTWTGAPRGLQVQKSRDLHLDQDSVGPTGAKKP